MEGAAARKDPQILARATLQAMERSGVPPTPRNYAAWYASIAGANGGGSADTDARPGDRTDDVARRRILDAGGHLQALITQAQRYVGDHADGVGAFGQALDGFSTAMGQLLPGGEMPRVIADLVRETQAMAERNGVLEGRLNNIAGEVDGLRKNLELVQREAITDPLTGIPNRKYFDIRLSEAGGEADRDGVPVSLIICDIDHFKRFNDNFGHQIGDQVLRLVARTLADSTKGRDAPARIGGEEFGIILPRTNLKQGIAVANDIRNAVQRRRIVAKESGALYGNLSLSFGIAERRPREPAEHVFRRADAALYHAKRAGRDRISTELDLSKPDASSPLRRAAR